MNKFLMISIISAAAVCALFSVAGCVLTNELSGTGKELQKLDHEISELRDSNTLLSEEIASRSAVLIIQAEARKLGFTTAIHTETIGPMSVAIQTVR
jgi:cell division protein FtsL